MRKAIDNNRQGYRYYRDASVASILYSMQQNHTPEECMSWWWNTHIREWFQLAEVYLVTGNLYLIPPIFWGHSTNLEVNNWY